MKSIFLYIKVARGLMLRYIAENKIDNIEGIKAFNIDGYSYSEGNSEGLSLTFIR